MTRVEIIFSTVAPVSDPQCGEVRGGGGSGTNQASGEGRRGHGGAASPQEPQDHEGGGICCADGYLSETVTKQSLASHL